MSEQDSTDDPYRTPGPRSGEPGPAPSPGPLPVGPYGGPDPAQPSWQQPGAPQPYPAQPSWQQPDPSQPYGQQPYPSQPYGQQPYPSQPYGEQPYGGDGLDRSVKPPTVVRLVQVMLAGAVVALLQGVLAVFQIDDLFAESSADLEEVAATSGFDPAGFLDLMSDVLLGVIIVTTLVTVGLWLLFARLFDRGSGRVAGTVLGALNAVGLLFGLQPGDLLVSALVVVELAIVITGLVLLWRPASSAWFGAMAAARSARWA